MIVHRNCHSKTISRGPIGTNDHYEVRCVPSLTGLTSP